MTSVQKKREGLESHVGGCSQRWSYQCDKCDFTAVKVEDQKSHMEAVHRDENFNVTSVISQQHKRGNLGAIKIISQG